MKIRKVLLPVIIVVVAIVVGLYVFVVPSRYAKGEDETDTSTASSLLEEVSIDEILESEAIPGRNAEIASFMEFPNYYHSSSDVDATSIYFGADGIYRIDSESGVQKLYSAPHMAGAALYGDSVFSLEYNVTDSGLTINLIRINKNDSVREVMAQVGSGSYDLRAIDNMLIISEEIIGDRGLETVFRSYTLDDEGNLTSDVPQDAYNQFALPEGVGDGMSFLIDPWFSTKYFGYSCFIKNAGETDKNSVWIRKQDEELVEEAVVCSGKPLLACDRIFYCDSCGKTLVQRFWDNIQEIVIYEIPDGNNLVLLTYDAEWVYFMQEPGTDESNEMSASITRVNLQDHRTEEIYVLKPGDSISRFNVYGNNCFFVLSNADYTSSLECCDLTDFTIMTIH